jgi:hypothetical protein
VPLRNGRTGPRCGIVAEPFRRQRNGGQGERQGGRIDHEGPLQGQRGGGPDPGDVQRIQGPAPIRQGRIGGFVANFAQKVMTGQLPLPVRRLRGERVELFGRSEALFPGLNHHLFFPDHVHEFDPN